MIYKVTYLLSHSEKQTEATFSYKGPKFPPCEDMLDSWKMFGISYLHKICMSMSMQPIAQKLFGYSLNVMDIKTSVSEFIHCEYVQTLLTFLMKTKTQRVTLVFHDGWV